ncbi:DUF485 domain-containing protein [Nitrogeniibacter mangrovi]|uniref:DUF485 domain-containing protein n=1 Tax=Nitrogeniibacter mangrovi TaxID=2016596 RepID=A0A6C1B164_9RHOO|nr:DUF485 domain-containing protein [Nitrogeniibacter mangrovi]QID17103.1 DUF485 domain-containing protein [Nitrogeniibacter mangrovi]
MQEETVRAIKSNPKYQQLVSRRKRFGWTLTALMLVVYYGYILLIAFDKEFLAQKVGDGVTSLGVPIGLGVIIFTVIITGVYVRRANTEFDELGKQIVEEVSK